MKKLIRITTVPISLKLLLKGQHRFMTDKGYKVLGISSSGDELEEVARSEGIRVESLKMTRAITPIQDVMALYNFYKICKKEKPFIIHSHTPKAGLIAMVGGKMARVPNRLHTVAGLPLLETKGLKRKLLNFIEKLTYASATKIYPNSFGLQKIIIEENLCCPTKLKVIGNGSTNGINTSYFDPAHFSDPENHSLKAKLKIKQDEFIFIFVGRLVADKGINELVAAFKMLKIKNVKLLLVGMFEKELDPLETETYIEIEKNPDIIYVGFQEDVRPYFSIANALVFPSYREGFPNVVMQAGAMGLPSIVTNINGCNEIIINDFNGLIVPVKNKTFLAFSMRKIATENELYQDLKQNSRKRILENYEQIVLWNALLAEYRNLTVDV